MADKRQPEAVTDADHERRIADAAHNLLDACNAAIPADMVEDRKGQSIALAIQGIAMCDHMEPGKALDERHQRVDPKFLTHLFRALGRGMGDVLGAIPEPILQGLLINIFTDGMVTAAERRMEFQAGLPRKGK